MSGRTSIVTGSASGIGAAVASALAAQGDRVLGIDLAGATIDADLGSRQGRQDAVAAVLAEVDVVDTVVACAGIARPIPATMSVNYFGTVDLLEGLLPHLQRSPAPRVVSVTSVAAVHPTLRSLVDACLDGDEAAAVAQAQRAVDAGKGIGIYAASKQAVSRWIRRTAPLPGWAGHGVTLNGVGPGVVLTPMVAEQWADPDGRAELSRGVPMPLTQAPIEVEQMVRAVRFLASPDNTAITGQVLYVDAGADATIRGDGVW